MSTPSVRAEPPDTKAMVSNMSLAITYAIGYLIGVNIGG